MVRNRPCLCSCAPRAGQACQATCLLLVRAARQVCSCNLLLASRDLEAEMVELEGWAMHPACPPSEVCHLLDDMAEWLSFQVG